MNWEYLILMLNSPNIEDRNLAYAIISQNIHLIEANATIIITGILNNALEHQFYNNDDELVTILNLLHEL
jgi:hypothetical protein